MLKKDVLSLDLSTLVEKLGSSKDGLTQKQAMAYLAEHGANQIKKKSVGPLTVLGHQFQSSLIYLLIVAGLICYGIKDYSDGTVILVILLINTFLGFFQEYRSEKIVEKLSQFISKQVRIKRDGQFLLLDESQVVPGDVIMVREGDIAPADMRLIDAEDLQVNESQLTGESVPITKIPSDGAKISNALVFTGSVIEKGEGVGIVYATGNETELGTIAKLSTETKKETQYERSLKAFSSFLIKVTLSGLALVFVFKIILDHGFSNATNLLLFIIAMAVAIVPEVLPVIATVTLSGGALKLAKKHVVVKRLSSLEDLGNVNLLCTDKTGTLTENKMVINKITSIDDELFQKFAYASIIPLKGRKRRAQNSYDDAFLNYVSEAIKREAKNIIIAKELPFDPDARRSRVILEDTKAKKYYLISMGAPEALFSIAKGARKNAKYMKELVAEGNEGLHHLAIAYKEVKYTDKFDILKNERGLTFLGYASFNDPLRPSAKSTIHLAEKLGIKIKVLTGDSREVAEYVGREVGLVDEKSKVYIGDELDAMSEDQFKAAVLASNVFARVSPTQKYNIIKSLKESYVVAYQGDGINDAPALKLADVAIAVNSAMDIAKENADIVLLNKGLEVVINGIHYGRSIFVNINKYIKYTMVSNFGNFIALAALYLMSTALPLLPVQVLLTSVLTDIPLITVSSDTVEDSEVVRPEKHDVRELVFISLILGVPTALFEIFYFVIIRSQPQGTIETSLYVFLTFLSLIIFYAVRNKENFWKAKPASLLMNCSFIVAFIFSLGIIYIPQFQQWFSFVPLTATSLGLILLLMICYFFATDFVKVLYYSLKKD
jgi:Mg2+-importing ATPase